MPIYCISDLHLSLGTDKPMDVFGEGWEGYVDKINTEWRNNINEDDTVVIPGDTSWATYIEDAEADFAFIDSLPGNKILLKGNHDYWWSTISKMESYVSKKGFNSIKFLNNQCYMIGGTAICGTRGWKSPTDKDFGAEDKKIYEREIIRLELSLKSCIGKNPERIIAALHYPPFGTEYEKSKMVELMNDYKVDICIYGHIHGEALKTAFNGEKYGMEFRNVSADSLRFKPMLIEK